MPACLLCNPSSVPLKVPQISDQVIILTGGYSGLGLAAAKAICTGQPRLLLIVGRNADKGMNAVNELKACYPGAPVEFMHCDLASFDSIRAFAAAFLDRQLPLHCLINNAGVMLPTHTKSPEGLEITVATNFFGAFLLTHLLQPKLIETAPSRVVWMSSYSESWGQLHWDDLGLRKSKTSGFVAYATSNMYKLMAAKEMAKRLQDKGVLVVACQPGAAYTELPRKVSPYNPLRWVTPVLFAIMSQRVNRGAISMVWSATAEGLKPGGFYGPNYLNLFNTGSRWSYNRHTNNPADMARFYDAALQMIAMQDSSL